MMEENLISVIVPVYNVEKYLGECVDSILNQTYTNIEVILIDDGSKDNSGVICNQYEKKDNRVKVIRKTNEGVSSARNLGIAEAKGEWISFVDSDDWIEPNYLEELLKSAKENGAEIAMCGYNRVTGEKKESINSLGKVFTLNRREYIIKLLNPQTGYGFCHMKIFKAECIKNTVFDTTLKVGEDVLFNEQVSENITSICIVEKNLYNYRINSNSVVRKYTSEYANNYLESMKKNKDYLLRTYGEDEEIRQNYYNFVAFHILLIAVNYCYNKDNNVKNKTNLCKQICKIEEFEEGIRNSNYNNLSITRKITLFTIKHKFFWLTKVICNIRNIQNKKNV